MSALITILGKKPDDLTATESIACWMARNENWDGAEEIVSEQTVFRAVVRAAEILLEGSTLFWFDGNDEKAIKRCAGCDFEWGEEHGYDCRVGSLIAALKGVK